MSARFLIHGDHPVCFCTLFAILDIPFYLVLRALLQLILLSS
jgi:hypothetical protein